MLSQLCELWVRDLDIYRSIVCLMLLSLSRVSLLRKSVLLLSKSLLLKLATCIARAIEAGFEYVCDLDSARLFRKRK
jgi:hypothetical protein